MVKNPTANTEGARDTGSISGLRRSPGGGNGNALQYSCQDNPMNRGAWWAVVHGAAVSNLFGISDWFLGRQFFHGLWGVGKRGDG